MASFIKVTTFYAGINYQHDLLNLYPEIIFKENKSKSNKKRLPK